MPTNKVVLRFKDGTVIKGLTNDFFPNKKEFHLESDDGKMSKIIMEDLKAVFFVKDYAGDSTRDDIYDCEIIGAGRKIHLIFKDREEMIAFCHAYSSNRQGFFIVPADDKGNNERIYVVNTSVKRVNFL